MTHLRVAGGSDCRIRRGGPALVEPERPPEVSSRPLRQRRSIRLGPELGALYLSRPSRRLWSNPVVPSSYSSRPSRRLRPSRPSRRLWSDLVVPPSYPSPPLRRLRPSRPSRRLRTDLAVPPSYPSRPSRQLRSNLPCGGGECRKEEESSPPQCDGGNVDSFENEWNGCGGLGWEDPSRKYNKL